MMRRSKEDRYIREINEPVCRRMIFPAEVVVLGIVYAAVVILAVLLGWGCSVGVCKLMVLLGMY